MRRMPSAAPAAEMLEHSGSRCHSWVCLLQGTAFLRYPQVSVMRFGGCDGTDEPRGCQELIWLEA